MKPAESWKPINGALTAPAGYHWESNGESRFSGKRKTRLVKNSSEKEVQNEKQSDRPGS